MSHHRPGRVATRAGLAAAATAALLAIPAVALADTCTGTGPTGDTGITTVNPAPTPPPFGVVTPIVPGGPVQPTDPGNAFNPDHSKKPVHGKPGHRGKRGHAGKTGHKGKTTDATGTSGHKHKKHPTRKPVHDDGPTSTRLSVSAGKNQHADQPLTLTAHLTADRGHNHRVKAETGTITFVIDGQSGKPVPVKHGRASEKIDLKEGRHTVTADYSGDADYQPSESAPIDLNVS